MLPVEVSREVVSRHKGCSVYRVWYEGWVPMPGGVFTRGFRGEKQTIVTVSSVIAIFTLEVEE